MTIGARRDAESPVCIDDVISRIAARLRRIHGSLPPLEFEALAHDLVLDVTRFVLRWAEERSDVSRDLDTRRVEVRE